MLVDPTAASNTVLLLDQEWVSTLYVGLALTQAGYKVHVLTAAGGTDLSRWFQWKSGPAAHDPAYLTEVARQVEACRPRWVIPLTEKILSRVWESAPEWESTVFPATASWQRDLLVDKYALAMFVAQHGVLVPRARCVSPARALGTVACDRHRDAADACEGTLSEIIAELGLPIVVKPPYGAGGDHVSVCETEAEARARIREMADLRKGEVILQQYIEGETYLVGGVFARGETLRLYGAHKLELFPARVGPAQRLRSTTDPALLDAARRVFRLLEWTGFASADFMRGHDGRYYFLEVNPRPWGSIAAAADAGVDLFTPYAALLRGETVAPDLRCRDGVVSTLFPQRMTSRIRPGQLHSLLRALADPASWRAIPWRRPSLAWHLAKRVYWTYN